MVVDRLSDGVRIAQLLSSELDADGGRLDALAVVDADRDVEPTVDGAFAYGVDAEVDDAGDDSERIADVYVHPDRAHVEFRVAPDVAADAAREAGLRVRPKAVRPPRTLVFVEDGAQVKHVRAVFAAVISER